MLAAFKRGRVSESNGGFMLKSYETSQSIAILTHIGDDVVYINLKITHVVSLTIHQLL